MERFNCVINRGVMPSHKRKLSDKTESIARFYNLHTNVNCSFEMAHIFSFVWYMIF